MNHDHSGHGGMDHGGDGGMDMGGMCSMNMIWNTDIIDTCIVFPSWHIRSNTDFVLSFFAIVALGIFYEWLRVFSRRIDHRVARGIVQNAKGKSLSSGRVSPSGSPSPPASLLAEEDGLLSGRRSFKASIFTVPIPARVLRASLYAATVFLSFFLMLVFMTYNAYLILAVVLGAGAGHYLLGGSMDVDSVLVGTGVDGKGMACH